MSKKKIEILDDMQHESGANSTIPLDTVDASNELYNIKEMRDQMYQQTVIAGNQVKRLNECINRACKEIPSLMDALAKTAKAAENGFKVKVPENGCRELEKAADAVSDKVLKRMEAKSKDLVDIMTRHRECIPVPLDIFWCLIFCLIVLACFFALIILYNSRLQVPDIWRIIAAFSMMIVIAIGLTIYLRCRKSRAN